MKGIQTIGFRALLASTVFLTTACHRVENGMLVSVNKLRSHEPATQATPIDDETDVDSDGLLGRGERALGRNPLVSDNPLMLTKATPPDSDTLAFTVPLKFNVLAAARVRLQLMVDGQVDSFQRWDKDASGNCLLLWDPAFVRAGVHSLQVQVYVNKVLAGAGAVLKVATATFEPPYEYPLLPGTFGWAQASYAEIIQSVQIPQTWIDRATPWQLFCSVVKNPYFATIWIPGTSRSEAYSQAKEEQVPLLSAVETSPCFGRNALRYLTKSGLPTMDESSSCPDNQPCIYDYFMVCHMAGLDSSLNSLDQTSCLKLFELALCDADYLIATHNYLFANVPLMLLYNAYAKLTSPPMVLPQLTAAQRTALDEGDLPQELLPIIAAAKARSGLTSRPQ